MTAEPPDPDAALDRLWAVFFAVRADVAAGRTPTAVALDTFRELHARAGDTGSVHVPVFRAEIRGEIVRVKGGTGP